MATLNRINRAIDSLKKVTVKTTDDSNKCKEKITLCLTITDLFCKSNEKNVLLPTTIISLIQLFEEADSNTRLVIDESLNKIIRISSTNPNHVAKILIAFLKILGKNTNDRILKETLWRLSELAHFIRPQQGKAYVQMLVPIIIKIADKKDENTIQTLANSLPNILKYIGLFTTESDIKVLLKAFLRNLYSDCIEIQRAAACSIIVVCKYSRKPTQFFLSTLTTLLDLLHSTRRFNYEDRIFKQGCLCCIRQILPFVINSAKEIGKDKDEYYVEHLVSVFEFCLEFAKFQDYNVVTFALETLNQLFQESPSFLFKKLSASGLLKSVVPKHDFHSSTLSITGRSDTMSISSTIARSEEEVFTVSGNRMALFSPYDSCTELNCDQTQTRTEKWVEDQLTKDKDSDSLSSSLLNIDASHFANSDEEDIQSEIDASLSSSFRALSPDHTHQTNYEDQLSVYSNKKYKSISEVSAAIMLHTFSIDFDIGSLSDENEIPLNYCARFLVTGFLLEGASSKKVRVSILSLVISCFAQLLKMNPEIGFISIERNGNIYEGYNNLFEVILHYKNHEDQQIRGLVRIAIGNFIVSLLIEQNYFLNDCNSYCIHKKTSNELIDFLLQIISEGIEDDSFVCVKHSLQATSLCIPLLLHCSKFKFVLLLLDKICSLVGNSYWLIKLKILENINEISYEVLYYTAGNDLTLQEKIFRNVIIAFLADQDSRVRNTAVQSLIKFVQNAYYPIDHKFEPVSSTYAKQLTTILHFHRFPSTIKRNCSESIELCDMDPLERSLARIIYNINQIMIETSSKSLMIGCCEALSTLATKYEPINYSFSWQCVYIEKCPKFFPCELFNTALYLMTNTPLIVNFDAHPYLLRLTSHLFTALCQSNLKFNKNYDPSTNVRWHFLSDRKLSYLSELFLQHMIRLMNMFNDVVMNLSVKCVSQSAVYSMLPLPVDKTLLPNHDLPLDNERAFNFNESESRLEELSFMHYSSNRLFVKLRESLKSAFNNYMISLKTESSEKFISFLKTLLESLCIALDYISTIEINKYINQLLMYLQNFIVLLPVDSVHSTVQLLRSVFGTNKITQDLQFSKLQNHSDNLVVGVKKYTNEFYVECFKRHYTNLSNFSLFYPSLNEISEKLSNVTTDISVEQQSKQISLSILRAYIKLFESNVIQALREYTITSDTKLQAEVLYLLSELIQLKVNYCMLDSEQVFIKFVLSQFQLIEEQHILNLDDLLPQLFNFLINLAGEKHSKIVMSVPKVIQLCDMLIASGQSTSKCILAIEPIIQYVFIKLPLSSLADTNEYKELETQRDVLFAMLLKLVYDHKTLRLLTTILNHSDEESKLKRSDQIVKILFNVVVDGKISVNSEESYRNIVTLLFTLHPVSYNEHILLNTLINAYHLNKNADYTVWLPCFCAILLMIANKYNGETILLAVEKIIYHAAFCDDTDDETVSLSVSMVSNVKISSVNVFVRFLCKILYSVLQRYNESKLWSTYENEADWKNKLFCELLLIVSYITRSGKYECVKNEFNNAIFDETEDKMNFIKEITYLISMNRFMYPMIALKWYEFLLQLKSKNIDISQYFVDSKIPINIFQNYKEIKSKQSISGRCLNYDVLKTGMFLLTCSHKNEFIGNTETFKLFLDNNFDEVVNFSNESVVQDLLFDIQKSEQARLIFIEIIKYKLYDKEISSKKLKWLECTKLVPKEIVLNACYQQLFRCSQYHWIVYDEVISVALRCAEYLLQLQRYNEDELDRQIGKMDLQKFILDLKELKYCPRKLILLLSELSVNWHRLSFDLIVPEKDERDFNIDNIHSLTIDKDWLLNEVKYRCFNEEETNGRTTSLLLSQLPLQDILLIMQNDKFNMKILHHCFLIGTELTLHECISDNENETKMKFSCLYLGLRHIIFHHLEQLKLRLPGIHEVYLPIGREINENELSYKAEMDKIFSNIEFKNVLYLIVAIDEYLKSAEKLIVYFKLESIIHVESYKCLCEFGVLCAEFVHWLIKNERNPCKISIINAMKCCISILKVKEILNVISVTQMGSIIASMVALVEFCTKENLKYTINDTLLCTENVALVNLYTCSLVSSLIDFFITKTPMFFNSIVKNIVHHVRELLVVVCQSSLLYNYVKIPLEIWKNVTQDDIIVDTCLTLNKMPENYLRDSDILRNFVSRLMFMGWNNRLQFEECWMSLLGAINLLPDDESLNEESHIMSQVNAIAISAITSLLVQSMYQPKPGCKMLPYVFHMSRYMYPETKPSRWKLKFEFINNLLKMKMDSNYFLYDNLNVNIDRLFNKHSYDFNQVSVEYLSLNCVNDLFDEGDNDNSLHHNSIDIHIKSLREKMDSVSQGFRVDTNSCVHFLINIYSSWFLKSNDQSGHVLIEIVNCMLVMSDLFTELSQFSWLFETSVLLWKKYNKSDVVVIRSYLTVAICKSASVKIPKDNESRKLVIKVLKSGLQSRETMTRHAATCGLFYLLESIFKKETIHKHAFIYVDYEENILSAAILNVLENLDIELRDKYDDCNMTDMISLAFYLVENNCCGDNKDVIIDRLCKICVRVCKLKFFNVYRAIIQGFYNLIMSENEISKKYYTELSRLVKEIFALPECSTCISILNLQLLTALMYSSDDFEDTRNGKSNEVQFDPEKLIFRIEKISIYFERIKKSCKSEVNIICAILPEVLNDFFPVSEILNKVILEFLSSQQPYPELMGDVVFKVFQNGIRQSQLSMIQDWVISLLNNFSHFPIPKAVFYLTCFFISASTNSWLTKVFPCITPKNIFDDEDRKFLCIATTAFYSQLQNDIQKRTFVTTFQSAEKLYPNSLFSDIWKTIFGKFYNLKYET